MQLEKEMNLLLHQKCLIFAILVMRQSDEQINIVNLMVNGVMLSLHADVKYINELENF